MPSPIDPILEEGAVPVDRQIIAADRELFSITARVVAVGPDDAEQTGTAFLVSREFRTFLVTARHLVEGCTALIAQLPPAQGASGTASPCGPVVVAVPLDDVRYHPCSAVDLAAVPFDAALDEIGSRSSVLAWPANLTATEKDEEGLGIAPLIYVGYPYGYSGQTQLRERSATPVARQAMIASPVDVDYDGLPTFLIDGHVAPGSSGSPVFLVNRDGSLPRSAGAVLLGVIVQSVNVPIAEVPGLDSELLCQLQEPAGLGVVVKASALRSCFVNGRAGSASR
jgi:hypothetical protein